MSDETLRRATDHVEVDGEAARNRLRQVQAYYEFSRWMDAELRKLMARFAPAHRRGESPVRSVSGRVVRTMRRAPE